MVVTRALLITTCLLPLPASARSLDLFLGDANTTHNGAGSPDDVYVDPAWVGAITLKPWPGPFSDFDVRRVDHNVAFTFLFPLQPGEVVTAATLTLNLQSTYSEVSTDGILLDSIAGVDVYDYDEMGWLPLPSTGNNYRSIDLASTLNRNALPLLQDGQLNVLVRDDSLVNHATLSLLITSLPGDANADGVVNRDDLALLDRGAALGLVGYANGDFNSDNLIDAADYAIYYNAAASPAAPTLAVPEPATLSLLALTPLLLSPRRRPRPGIPDQPR